MVTKTVPKVVSTKKPVKSAETAKQTASKTTTPIKQEMTAKTTNLPIAAVTRIAKNNGAERVGSDAAELLVKKAEEFIGNLTKEANKLASHAGRKTLKGEDVELASQKN